MPIDGKQFLDVRDLIDAKQKRVEEREGHGNQPQPEPHRADDGQGNQRSAPQYAQRIKGVPDRVFNKGGAARIAAFLLDLLRAAEQPQRLTACGLLRNAGCLQPFDLALEMELQLFVDLPRHAVGAKDVQDARQPGHGVLRSGKGSDPGV